MANTLVTPTWVTNETAQRFINSVKGVANFNRSYDDSFMQSGAKVGATVLARLPQQYTVRRGSGWSPQALYDRTVPVTISYQTGVDFAWTSAQATLELDRVRERYVNPAADTLASDADALGMADVYASVYNSVGTPGTTPSTNLTYLQAFNKIFDGAGRDDRLIAVLDGLASITLVNANLTSFNPQEAISQMFKRGLMGRGQLGVSEWYRDQNVPRHTTGSFTAASPTVNGASQTGSSLVTQAWASGATSLKKGDIFTIANVYSVNPLSKVSTGRLQQFVITADISDTAGAATLSISPSIITSGALQTVSASPANGAAISVWGEPAGDALTSVVSPQSLMFDPDFAAFVMVDLEDPIAGAKATFARDRDWGISLRFVQQYDTTDDQNKNRMDIMHGASILLPHLACRVVG
jgi:hypothetical protein